MKKMETKTMEFYETRPNTDDEEQTKMLVKFATGYETKFIIEEYLGMYPLVFNINNSDLQKLARAIIDKLEGTPYAVTTDISGELEGFIRDQEKYIRNNLQ